MSDPLIYIDRIYGVIELKCDCCGGPLGRHRPDCKWFSVERYVEQTEADD